MAWPHFAHGIAYEFRRIRKQKTSQLGLKLVSRVVGLALWFVLLPVTLVMHIAGYRRVTVFTDRIGHLALEPDCLIKEQILGLVPHRRWFILAPPSRVANYHLLSYWKQFFRVYESSLSCFILGNMSRWVFMRHDVSHHILALNKAQAAYQIYALWNARPPLLALTAADDSWGTASLQKLGMPNDAWFVCVHVREAGFSPIDEELHAHRNGTIEAVIPAIEEIVKKGGWVIRIGDASMRPLPPLPQTIDYAHHPMKSERLDIVLCAKARFILGNTSGISMVGGVFGTPCALANMIPFSALGLGPKDISIPKLLWSEDLLRYLTSQEILDSPIANFTNAKLYQEYGVKVIENSPEDIRMLVLEIIENLELVKNSQSIVRRDLVSQKFASYHYGYGSIATVSMKFIENHPEVIKQQVKI